MKEVFKQLTSIWHELKGLQKTAFLAVLAATIIALSFVFLKTSSPRYLPLFPNKSISISEMETVESLLLECDLQYKVDAEKGFLVAAKDFDRAMSGLGELHKPKGAKGFELFDTNTWIKGEKELQVLEMRALKGQLEKDLAGFENIKSASVILDIPPQRTFNGSKFQTKASVILTLMPKAHLSASQLRAVTNHLAGAVRGLEPEMIAISDSTGKLYKAIDPEHKESFQQESAMLLEERATEKAVSLLERFVGEGHYHLTVQALLKPQTKDIEALQIAALIDEEKIPPEKLSLRKEIERQLRSIVKGYGVEGEAIVDFLLFDQKSELGVARETGKGFLGIAVTTLFVALALAALIPFLRKGRKKKSDEEALFKVMTKIDLKQLVGSMEREDPQTIALMVSYLEPAKAEQMIASLKPELQEEVLFYLAELERGSTT